MEDFNRRFARPPRNPHNAHRPVGDQDIDAVFSWQEERTMSRNLGIDVRDGGGSIGVWGDFAASKFAYSGYPDHTQSRASVTSDAPKLFPCCAPTPNT